jgi:hypothetical protein
LDIEFPVRQSKVSFDAGEYADPAERRELGNRRSQQFLSPEEDMSMPSGIELEHVALPHDISQSWEEIESSVGDSFVHPDDLAIRKWIYFFFCMGNFWLAFDNGIIPAC